MSGNTFHEKMAATESSRIGFPITELAPAFLARRWMDSPGELISMFKRAGLKKIRTFGNLKGKPVSPKTFYAWVFGKASA